MPPALPPCFPPRPAPATWRQVIANFCCGLPPDTNIGSNNKNEGCFNDSWVMTAIFGGAQVGRWGWPGRLSGRAAEWAGGGGGGRRGGMPGCGRRGVRGAEGPWAPLTGRPAESLNCAWRRGGPLPGQAAAEPGLCLLPPSPAHPARQVLFSQLPSMEGSWVLSTVGTATAVFYSSVALVLSLIKGG